MTLIRHARRIALVLLPLLLALPRVSVAQTYTITDLGTLGGNSSGARGINTSGQATGYAYITGNKVSDVFLYGGGRMSSLGTLGGTTGIGLAINTGGQVAGYSTLSNGSYRGFISINGRLTSVGTLAG